MTPGRRLLSIFALLLTAIFLISATMHSARADSLVVTVRDIRSDVGEIRIALYSSADNFLVDGRTAATQSLSARRGDVKVVFANLRPGTYAAAAFHDENQSGDFDTNFIGVPREGYEFSNGAVAALGPPDFEDASVKLVRITAETDLLLNY
ncbi:MAG: DUF2141 domain-containing protein [Proteobacteria bacterium]|nr:DUF2141 domain-containing protein [Pseudomonadota bacterium]MDA1356646.1 DUF2141 domain-containing protein [Pseudomonadota bacterium]